MKKLKKKIDIDTTSMLVTADGKITIDELESYVQTFGFTANFRNGYNCTLRDWFENSLEFICRADGQTGFQKVYSIEILLKDGTTINLGTAPRSSTGPDLKGLFWGSYGLFGKLSAITLRLKRKLPHPITIELPELPLEKSLEIVKTIAEIPNFSGDWILEVENSEKQSFLSIEFEPDLYPEIWQLIKDNPFLDTPISPALWEQNLNDPWIYIVSQWKDIKTTIKSAQNYFDTPLNSLYLTNAEHWGGGIFIPLSPPLSVQILSEIKEFVKKLPTPSKVRANKKLFFFLSQSDPNFSLLKSGKKFFYEKISHPERDKKNR